MADAKTYSEQEHLAILADRVAQETASLSTERDGLKTERDELATKLDVAESAKSAAETRVTETQKAFDEFKTGVEEEREAAARKDQRVTKLREAAKHLKDEFFEDEARITRIVAMDESTFDGYVQDLTASAVPAGSASVTAIPRETAMVGQPVDTTTQSDAGRKFILRAYAPAAKEA